MVHSCDLLSSRWYLFGKTGGNRKVHDECRADARCAVHLNGATALDHHTMYRRKAKTGALRRSLGGEKWFEAALECLSSIPVPVSLTTSSSISPIRVPRRSVSD